MFSVIYSTYSTEPVPPPAAHKEIAGRVCLDMSSQYPFDIGVFQLDNLLKLIKNNVGRPVGFFKERSNTAKGFVQQFLAK